MLKDDIIERAKKNDKNAFKLIFDSYRQKVYRTALLIVKNPQHAEDIVQETFMKVFMKIQKLKSSESFECWLYRITVNICFSFLKKYEKASFLSLEDSLLDASIFKDVDFEIPDKIIVLKETQERIMACIHSLPPKQRTVVILFYFNEFTVKDIAAITECSEGTVKSRLFYGKQLLKQNLSRENIFSLTDNMGGTFYEV